jgi:alkanesulfonate monooxygenase SsuD/methylene tetrahydromethanopterin reductase-like flavin-dependent oxidoreductase (luciferase family)
MNRDLRFGIMTVPNIPWEREVERWQLIESLEFDSIWTADHFVDPYRPDTSWFEGWTLLSALAIQTRHIRIGTLVTSIPLRNPAMLARQALTVDHISNGRLELGLGSGVSWDPVYSMIGLENWPPQERVARFREAVEIVDLCLRNSVTSYHGEYFHLHDAIINPRPVQRPRPPLTIGAAGQSMLKIAARYADAWNLVPGGWETSPAQMLQHAVRSNRLLDEYCKEIGRSPFSVRRSVLIFGSEAREIFDSPENFETVIKSYHTTGMTEFILYYPFDEKQIPVFKRIAVETIPWLREHISDQ